jgi:hypothetical protein
MRDNPETSLDLLLIGEVECQLIANQLTYPSMNDVDDNESAGNPSRLLCTTILNQLMDLKKNLPIQTQPLS